MDTITAFAIALIGMAIVFNLALAYRAYQDSKTSDSNLKEDILAVLLAQRDKQTTSHLDLNELSEKIDRVYAELTKISAERSGQKNLLPVLGALLERMNTQNQPQPTPAPTKNESVPSDDHSVFSHAIRLAKENMSPEKIVSICGIDLSEAELIVKIHGPAQT